MTIRSKCYIIYLDSMHLSQFCSFYTVINRKHLFSLNSKECYLLCLWNVNMEYTERTHCALTLCFCLTVSSFLWLTIWPWVLTTVHQIQALFMCAQIIENADTTHLITWPPMAPDTITVELSSCYSLHVFLSSQDPDDSGMRDKKLNERLGKKYLK